MTVGETFRVMLTLFNCKDTFNIVKGKLVMTVTIGSVVRKKIEVELPELEPKESCSFPIEWEVKQRGDYCLTIHAEYTSPFYTEKLKQYYNQPRGKEPVKSDQYELDAVRQIVTKKDTWK